MPVRDPNTPSSKDLPMAPSPYWGAEPIWDSRTSMHNPMMDERGRVWFTSRVGVPDNPEFCKKGSDHPSAKLFPIERSGRHLSMYDPKSGAITLIRTCFQTHHLIFAEDADNTLWTSSGGPAGGVVGWLNQSSPATMRHRSAAKLISAGAAWRARGVLAVAGMSQAGRLHCAPDGPQ
jgi:hypothetical protein